jgi:hypothetical protein
MKTKRSFLFFGAVFIPGALAAVVFASCTTIGTTSDSVVPGNLLITGIPLEYEGKYVSISWDSGLIITSSAEKPTGSLVTGAAIRNGEVNLPLYVMSKPDVLFWWWVGYNKNDIIDLGIVISDRVKASLHAKADVIFKLVKFRNGVATVRWNNAG